MIYPLLLILIVVFEIVKFHRKQASLDTIYSGLLWGILIFMAAFRASTVGADTPGYIEDYEMMQTLSYYQVSVVKRGYLGYFYLCKFFSDMHAPLWLWFGFVESVYIYAMFRFVKKYSADRIFSIMVFVTNGLFTFSMAGQKQVMSMGLILLAFLYFTEKKYLKMILAVAWGAACHSAGLIFIMAFIIYWIRNSKIFLYVALGVPIAIYALSKIFLTQITAMLVLAKEDSGEHFEDYLNLDASYTPTTFIFYTGAVIMAATFIMPFYRKYKIEGLFVYAMCIMACSLQTMSSINPTLFRLALPYTPFLMILLANTRSTIKNYRLRLFYGYAIWGCHLSYFLFTTKEPFEFSF